jgi:hypothetical protein
MFAIPGFVYVLEKAKMLLYWRAVSYTVLSDLMKP